MTQRAYPSSRRAFLRTDLAGLALLPVVLAATRARAAELPRLEEGDSAAIALGYVHDAASVDAAKRPDAANVCATCRFYADPASDWAACALLPGKAVSAGGWCTAWVARP